ncbi:hypothetical protein [Rubritalea sp.]|uniref:hypothetical protein n=1 Tax=Rubritalea sp. TaxID=2109375 RepID=UPI003EFAAB90
MIEENYQIEEMVEQAPLFVIYSAIEKESGQQCLIKRYMTDDSSEIGKVDGWSEKFTQLISEFSGQNIPSVRSIMDGGLDPCDGKACTIFEQIEVSSLKEQLYERTGLGLELTYEIAKSVLEGFVSLHAMGVLQAKLAPDSLFYTNAEHKSPWVITWDPIRALRCKYGVNHFKNDGFTAPELIAREHASAQSDLFCLGKTLEVAAGDLAADPAFSAWNAAMVHDDPQQRYASAQVALDALIAMTPEPQPVAQIIQTAAPENPVAQAVAFAGLSEELATDETEDTAPAVAGVTSLPVATKSKPPVLLIAVLACLVLAGGAYIFSQGSDDEGGFEVVSEYELEDIDSQPRNTAKKEASKKQKAKQQSIQQEAKMVAQQEAEKKTQEEAVDEISVDTSDIPETGVILKYKDVKKAKAHVGEEVLLKGVLKDIIIAKGNLYVLTFTSAKSRKGTICMSADTDKFYPELKLPELRHKLLNQNIIATGKLVENPHTFSIHLVDKDAIKLVDND